MRSLPFLCLPAGRRAVDADGETRQQYDEARIAVGFVAALVNQPAEEGRSGSGVRTPLQGHVEFSNVMFKYKGATSPALEKVSFEVPAGHDLGHYGPERIGKDDHYSAVAAACIPIMKD